MNEKYNVYLVSDSTGETLDRIFLSLKSQFANFEYEKKEFAFVRTEQQIDKIIKECIKLENSLILYTIVETKLAKYISVDFVISSIDNSKFGEVVALVFKKNIPDNYKKAFTHLSKYETPKEVLVIDNFPENNGKINRLKIRSIINNS